MNRSLGEFRLNFGQKCFDVLGQSRFAFTPVELFQAAIPAARNVARNASDGSLGVAGLDRLNQVKVISANLLERGDIVPAAARREDSNQQPNAGKDFEAPAIPGELHQVGVKRKIGDLKAFHLLLIQRGLVAAIEFFDERGHRRSYGTKIAHFSRRWRVGRDCARGKPFQGLSHFKQLADIVPVQRDHDDASACYRFKQSFADQLANRFARRSAADAQFFRDAHVGDRRAGTQLPGGNLALDVVVGHLAHRPRRFRLALQALMSVTSMYSHGLLSVYTVFSIAGSRG